jgi:4-hydroxy-4-methyl-2-oxoglutarate aldolase
MTIAPEPLASELAALGSATVYEAAGKQGALTRTFAVVDASLGVAGPVRLVACPPGDNLAIHRAVAVATPGEVLVVDAGGYLGAGHWGEILTVAAQARGIAGLVIDGSVRDSQAIKRRGFPIFYGGLSIVTATKAAPAADPPAGLQFAGCTIRGGDWIVADADGIVVIPAERIEEVAESSRNRLADEQRTMESLLGGRTTLDLFGWR